MSLKPKGSLLPNLVKRLLSPTLRNPTQTWEEVLAKKDNKTQDLEYDRALALSLIASSSQAISKQEYDLANAKFALQLAQKRPPQITTPLLATSAINPMDTPYTAKPAKKTREYYELILVHSRSIELTRYTSKEDETLITHSTLHILKVLTPSQWGQDLAKPKLFGIKFNLNLKDTITGTIIMPDPGYALPQMACFVRYYTGYPKDLGPSRVIHFTSEREFIRLLHEGYPVVVAFTIRVNYTKHLDKVLEEAAA
ncbi:hypothetical protein K1719_020364 [Acacia pycnantha]|nr:hypothetical protein K1719_020364 [Acacia pycnantha]